MIRAFLKRPATVAFLAFTVFYAVCLGFIFGGTWSCAVAAVQPDAGTTFPLDQVANNWRNLLGGSSILLPGEFVEFVVSPWALQEFRYALAVWFGALGLAYYLRGRGLDWLPSYGAGAAYGLMGYTFTLFSAGHYGWFSWLTYGPFAFGLTDRAVRGGCWRHWVLLGAVLAWGAARQPDMWLLFTVLTFFYGVWCLVRERATIKADKGRSLILGLMLTAVVTALVGAPAFFGALTDSLASRDQQIAQSAGAAEAKEGSEDPAAKAKAEAERWRFCTSWSLPPEDIVEFFWPRVNGDTSDVNIIQLRKQRGWRETTPYTGRLGMPVPGPNGEITRWMPYRQHALYFGFITVVFAALALVLGLRKREGEPRLNRGETLFWAIAALVLVFCAMGCFTPFYRLVYALPFGGYLRAPVKFVHLVEFAVAVLAGFGAAAVLTRFGKLKSIFWGVLALLVINALDLARIDALYLGPLDVSFVRADNAAAADALTAGGGKVAVCVPPQQGGQLIGDSFRVHGVSTADLAAAKGNPFQAGARFLFVTGDVLAKNADLNARLKDGRLKLTGTYALSGQKGLMRVASAQAQAVLLEIPGAPADKETPLVVPPLKRTLNYVSALVTLLLLAGMGHKSLRTLIARRV